MARILAIILLICVCLGDSSAGRSNRRPISKKPSPIQVQLAKPGSQQKRSVVKEPVVETTIRIVTPNNRAVLGEGPYYSENEKVLYQVDIFGSAVWRVDTVSGQVTTRSMNGPPVSMVIPYENEPGNLLVTSRNQLLKLNFATGVTQQVAVVAPELNGLERFNDAKCDPRGRLFIGTLIDGANDTIVPNAGSLYRLDGNSLTRVAQGFTISNGMAWSNNGTKFYFNDSGGRKIYVYDYNVETGAVSNQRVLIDLQTHADFVDGESNDGMAIDAYGYIWVAMWNGGRVVKINPVTASVVDQVRIPNARIPSSLAFGDYRGQFGFYLTTASTGIPVEELVDDGKTMHVAINGGSVNGFIP